ncbi:DEAD/DEAH box helicase family protein [Alienimonas californiensis]|uniref:Uncharacterized protein n=1 Tax=Alienimonas californiensis TaxID=2527989 RepID=A0A517P8N7_9PLAN|nr:DEAD/DEAH box helicase family protein [Alienimonas californiensis]QDT15734.1 hypothetical protein CA12_18260 [Alienimonas californiensis]
MAKQKPTGAEPAAPPIVPPDNPVLCNPYEEPHAHWFYDRSTGLASETPGRRPGGFFYKTEEAKRAARGRQQLSLLAEEQRVDFPVVNRLREDVTKWREADYRGASKVTKELLRHWTDSGRAERGQRRLFFCQREAIETLIYLLELRVPGRSTATGFRNFSLSDDDLKAMLDGRPPSFAPGGEFSLTADRSDDEPEDFAQTLLDRPNEAVAGIMDPTPLIRLGCKMATGSGKTLVMAMLIAWAFCNRSRSPASRQFFNAVLVCCPNLTVRERLGVLIPDSPGNYYKVFDLIPVQYRDDFPGSGKVLVTNWHKFAPEGEHTQGGVTAPVIQLPPEDPADFTARVLEEFGTPEEIADRFPLLVLNDEGHHCWRQASEQKADEEIADLDREEKKEAGDEVRTATVWTAGLDRINNAPAGRTAGGPLGGRGIGAVVDLSATPFYIAGSGHGEGVPFPWLVSDFGLVDAIESGIVKVPRMPVQDTTGRPEPRYFRLWQTMKDGMAPGELVGRTGKPKPEAAWEHAQDALRQLYDQWVERFGQIMGASDTADKTPPVLIVVCDSTAIADEFYRRISGVREVTVVGDDGKERTETVCGPSETCPEFANVPGERRTVRVDSRTVEQDEALRHLVSTVGVRGEPGEKVRCVVSVSMLTEGWDANTVTHILGVRAFGSQLLCEQVVGRGLRRMNYDPDPETGRLPVECVDVYGIPFSVIPFKGRPKGTKAPEDQPLNKVQALPARADFEIRFPIVEAYAFAYGGGRVVCDLDKVPKLKIDPSHTPTATFVRASVGYGEGGPARSEGVLRFEVQDRQRFYEETHPQHIHFLIARDVVDRLTTSADGSGGGPGGGKLTGQNRVELFPQVLAVVERFAAERVDYSGQNKRELGLDRYMNLAVDRLAEAIDVKGQDGEPPILPVLKRGSDHGSTADVTFVTRKPVRETFYSHINAVVADTQTWEQSAAFHLELLASTGVIACHAKNDHLGLLIPYRHANTAHVYTPDFLVRVSRPGADPLTLLLEVKGQEDEQTRQKHAAAEKWVRAVNNWEQLGEWRFEVCYDPQRLPDLIAAVAAGEPTPDLTGGPLKLRS